MIQPVQAQFNKTAGDSAFRLAKALGAIDLSPAQDIQNQQNQEAQRQATEYANSLTLDQLGQQIKDGSMLPSQSPAYRATLEHIYGENTLQQFSRDTLSKLATGDLKFNSTEDADAYLAQFRNTALAGASQYTTAGFDKGFHSFRQQVFDANAKVANEEIVQRGVQEASDSLGNTILQVTDPMYKGDAAQAVVDRYQLLRKTSLLRDDAAKQALTGAVANIAVSGNKDLLSNLLGKTLDSGVSVGAALGPLKAVQFQQVAERQYDQSQRQRIDTEIRPFVESADNGELNRTQFDSWVAQNEKYVTTPTIHAIIRGNQDAIERQQKKIAAGALLAQSEATQANATQAVRTAIDQGNLAFLPQQTVMTPQGESKNFDAKAAAVPYIQQRIQNSNMPFGKQVEFWATNGVENPEWQKQIQAGVSNLASVGWAYDGKNIGQLNPQGQAAVDTFMQVNNTNPAYAQKLVGSDKDYRTLSDIQFLVEKGGFPNVNDAAALVNQANRAGITSADYGPMKAQVANAVNSVVYPGMFGRTVSWVKGLFGNDQVNLTQMAADIRHRSELLVMSGQVPDANAAVKATVEYLANPAVTSEINNTVYFNKDLPVVPKGEDPAKWLGRFIEAVPAKIAPPKSDVRLEPNQYGGFTAWTGGVPVTDAAGNVATYTKDDISKWVSDTMASDRANATFDANYKAYTSRIEDELQQMSAKDPYALERYDPNVDHFYFNREILSKDAYRRIVKEGNANKPLKDLFSIYKARRGEQ